MQAPCYYPGFFKLASGQGKMPDPGRENAGKVRGGGRLGRVGGSKN